MFVRYLGGGIGHGENSADAETPTAPDDEPEDNLDGQLGGNHEEGDGEAVGESEDEGDLDSDGGRDIENEYSDDEGPEAEM